MNINGKEQLDIDWALDTLGDECHLIARTHGFWPIDDDQKVILDGRNFGEMIALMHSELSECLEADRKDSMDDHLPQYEGRWVEIADLIIRALEVARAFQVPIGEIIMAKMKYNDQREYKHGKKY